MPAREGLSWVVLGVPLHDLPFLSPRAHTRAAGLASAERHLAAAEAASRDAHAALRADLDAAAGAAAAAADQLASRTAASEAAVAVLRAGAAARDEQARASEAALREALAASEARTASEFARRDDEARTWREEVERTVCYGCTAYCACAHIYAQWHTEQYRGGE